jgi:hypothetical protein
MKIKKEAEQAVNGKAGLSILTIDSASLTYNHTGMKKLRVVFQQEKTGWKFGQYFNLNDEFDIFSDGKDEIDTDKLVGKQFATFAEPRNSSEGHCYIKVIELIAI